MQNKNDENENEIILGDFNSSMDKMDKYGGDKTQRFYRCCSSYTLIVEKGLKIYGEGRTQILLSSAAMIGPLARIQDRQGLYWYNNC